MDKSIFKKPTFLSGFTLVELIVSVSIIIVITVVVVFNQEDLGDQTALNNVVNNLDVQIREAQVYGISVKEFSTASNEFNIAYGVDFNLANTGASNNSFYTFGDRTNVNGYFDTFGTCTIGGTSECVGWNKLARGTTISKICAIQANAVEVCSNTVGRLAITFYRPNPTAKIVFFNSGGSLVTYPGYLGARIEISSPKGKKKSVVVYTTGQIAIQ
jgi:Tfp pilus assembly protein FimT